MQVLYDTRTVHPLDRYDYYRAVSASEWAPVAIHGRAPGRLLAAMSVAQIGDFEIEQVTWSADCQVVTLRTDRLIRVSDPECYRIVLGVSGVMRGEQAGNQVGCRAGDMALYDLSHPYRVTHGIESGVLQGVMLSFPRAWVPITRAAVRPLIGTVLPSSLQGRSLVAQFLIGLTEADDQTTDPGLADVVRECMVGLIRRRLGQPSGISSHTRRLLQRTHVRNVIRRNLGDPMLDLDRIARVANISPRYLHKIFEGSELTPMQLLKRLRLEACYRSLQDSALTTTTSIKDIISRHGYRRPDQFSRDFKQLFHISPRQMRKLNRCESSLSTTLCSADRSDRS